MPVVSKILTNDATFKKSLLVDIEHKLCVYSHPKKAYMYQIVKLMTTGSKFLVLFQVYELLIHTVKTDYMLIK